MKSHARAAVIGGGIMGCAMLYQLTRHGWADAVLIEKGELTSGSTWHAAGQVPYFAPSPLMARIQYESFESYQRLEAETGNPTGVHAVGALRLARSDDEVKEYHRFLAIARGIGIEGELIGPNETRAVWPLLEFDGFKAALYTFHDGYLDPSQTTHAFAKTARAGGAEIYRHTRVTALTRTPTGEWRIETDRGSIVVEVVINAAGFWGPEISAMVGGVLPIVAIEHQYLLTEPVPELADLGRELPVLRDLNVPMYLRQERGGMLVSCYEDHPVFFGLEGIPPGFGQELFAPDLDRAAPLLELTYAMVPALEHLGIKTVVNGPTGRSADLQPCVGPAHGLPGYFTLCGVVGGFLQSSLARYLAEWIVEGEPSIDLSPFDVRRFGDYATQAYAVAKVNAGHAYANPVYYPHGESGRGRPARTTPLFAALGAKGAVFGVDNGWEVPNWFAPDGVEPDDGTRFERQRWVEHAAAEAEVARRGAGLLDASNRAKLEVCGASALAGIERLSLEPAPAPGESAVTPFLTPKGGIAALLRVTRLSVDRFYLSGEAASEQRDFDWLRARLDGDGVRVTNVTARDGLLWLGGAATPEVLAAAGANGAIEAWPPDTVRTVSIGFARVLVVRVDDVVTPAFELIHAMDAQLALYEALTRAGAAYGLRDIGRRAFDALRIERGRARWGTDFAADCTPAEIGLSRASTERPQRRLVRVSLPPDGGAPVDPWGDEPIMVDGRVIGAITSATFAASLEGSIALAMIESEAARPGARVEVEVLGARRAAEVVGLCGASSG